jgi:hypothetical protein
LYRFVLSEPGCSDGTSKTADSEFNPVFACPLCNSQQLGHCPTDCAVRTTNTRVARQNHGSHEMGKNIQIHLPWGYTGKRPTNTNWGDPRTWGGDNQEPTPSVFLQGGSRRLIGSGGTRVMFSRQSGGEGHYIESRQIRNPTGRLAVHCIQAIDRRSLPSCTAISRA